MNNRIYDRTLTLTDFFKVFVKRLWIIVLAAVIGASVGTSLQVLRLVTAEQEYVSETILRLPQSDPMIDGSSIELSLINDYYRIIDSASVLHSVYESIDLSGKDDKFTYEDFVDRISILQHPSSRIIKITVQWTDAETSEKIADGICTEGLKKIKESMSENETSAMLKRLETDTQKLASVGNKGQLLKKGIIMGIGSGAAVYLVLIVMFWLDNKVRESDDIESVIGIAVLGTVPNEKLSRKMAGGHYDRILCNKMDKQGAGEKK